MFDLKSYSQVQKSSEKSFGFIFSAFFILLFFYLYLVYNKIVLTLLILGIILSFISFFISKVLKYPNYIWFRFGLIIGGIVSPVVMCIIYFFLFVPFGLLLKVFKIDILNLKFDKKSKTYWKESKDFKSTMKEQF